jgi:hypothetical protein
MVDIKKYILLLFAYEHYASQNLPTKYDYNLWAFGLFSWNMVGKESERITWMVAWSVVFLACSHAACST